MKKIALLILSLLFYTLTGLGISLSIIANIGVSSFNALNLSLAAITTIKIGTMTTMVNSLFLAVYILLTKGKRLSSYLIQAVSVLALGYVINFFVYNIFGQVVLTAYTSRLSLFVLGTLIGGFGTGMVLNLGVLAFPIESVCQFLAEKWQKPFASLRYGVDILSVALSLSFSLFSSQLFVREGTLISLLLLSFTISLTKKMYELFWQKRNDVLPSS
ncbi:hypothetical protein I6N95_19300 [Vagococcus sp. BWB3-3]|uniref:YitT family protein n=1 Tax=Vagococcus allomyrinae TaxID=2794353 RepID=A0A940SWM8_9ENTE|nr:hypothetical protein [Vagococcus allomyrinae]MBP1043169.1 hypothetical protein [Vagococcus allomyrinae]